MKLKHFNLMRMLFFLALFVSTSNAQCKWNHINLEVLSEDTIGCPFSSIYEILYTPCRNEVSCDSGATYMTTQMDTGQNDCIAGLALWDPAVSPKHSIYNDMDMWSFRFENGDESWGCPDGRYLDIEFICDDAHDAYPYNQDKTECGEEDEPCNYFIRIYSNLACHANNDNSSNSLSGGWIFVIILISMVVLYCLIGLLLNGYQSEQWTNISNNIPNYLFWEKLPSLVVVGCIVTKEQFFKNKSSAAVDTKD